LVLNWVVILSITLVPTMIFVMMVIIAADPFTMVYMSIMMAVPTITISSTPPRETG